MKSFYEQFKGKSRLKLSESLVLACGHNDFEKVKYLLTSSELKNHANINYNNDAALNSASIQGSLEIVKYLTSSPELKTHSNIYSNNSQVFIHACKFGEIEIVDFLLFSPLLKNHIDINKIGDVAFKESFYSNKLDVIEYLIFNADIKKTEIINDMLKVNPNQQIESWFEIRELNNNLKQELLVNPILNKKLKL